VLEVIAEANHLAVKVNGKPTAEAVDDKRISTSGHIALQHWNRPKSVQEFSDIEIKELPPAGGDNADPLPPAAPPPVPGPPAAPPQAHPPAPIPAPSPAPAPVKTSPVSAAPPLPTGDKAANAPPAAPAVPASAPAAKTLTVDLGSGVTMAFVRIPAGSFTMGSPADEKNRQKGEVQHDVTISRPFYMGAYSVTVGQFRRFVDDTGYKTEAENSGEGS
jgi:formylglycine-generating enzyme required for sulfatase activity